MIGKKFKRLVLEESGGEVLEYALIAGLIVVAAIAVIGIFTWARTNSHRTGGLIVGMLVTLYVVAGTATQV